MPQYVALLRGIMPSNSQMKNENLRRVFEKLGFKNIRTVISSGNVLFESRSTNTSALETKIEQAFPKELGFSSTTIIRSQKQLQDLVNTNPFKEHQDAPSSRLNVTFLKNPENCPLKIPYISEDKTYQLLHIYDGAICSMIDLSGTRTPDLMLWLEKQCGKQITTRTWKTVHRILAKLNES